MDDSSAELCSICLSAITERAITVPCNHYTFDFGCLARWLQQSSNCPLCKAEVTAVEYDWRSPTDFKTFRPPKKPDPDTLQNQPTIRSQLGGRFQTRRPVHRRPYSPPSPDTALLRRRYVYRNRLYSLHVGSNRISRYRNLTPQMITNSPDLQSRARMWIRRELRVFAFLNSDSDNSDASGSRLSNNAEFLLTYIISILKTVDIKSSTGHAEDLLQEFLGRENARLFLHELNAWLRSPYTKLEDWDRNIQYGEPLPERFDEHGRGIGRMQQRGCRSRSQTPHSERRIYRERYPLSRYEPD
ncbi:hypothetical protein GQ43DRAFT_373551 [Delitschia confertaspora ATCC 74209]|uniref:RING-type E3 ubiquitin transferase n=1 Tax=Delitschia confertaspora ATCC 74209 TaxID=1513339 RepID=A0A9P4JNU5_9PLEO|nr:hypothetical protein GQ43DRAFT_373551 [Delitschia confertaspora ATCC 74209]